jgi:hypothetical protein
MEETRTAVDPGAEEAARAHAQAVVAGDIGTTVLGMTPDALAKAMQLGNTTWIYLGSAVTPAGRDGEDCLFEITYQTDQGPFTLRDRFRRIDGEWKIVDIERVA